MLEQIVVSVVVAAAFVYALWALMPAGTRLRLARRLAVATGGPESTGVLARLARWLERAAGGGASCHGCDAHASKPVPRKPRPE